MILLDQIPRNAFRGSVEAFRNDEAAASLAEEAIQQGICERVPVAMIIFTIMPLMHSEWLSKHRVASDALAQAKGRYPDSKMLQDTEGFLKNHTCASDVLPAHSLLLSLSSVGAD